MNSLDFETGKFG